MKKLFAFLLVLATAASAAAQKPAVVVPAPPPIAAPNYMIGPGDVLAITVLNETALSGKFTVDSDGTISYPFLQRVVVQGKSLRAIEEEITKGLQPGYVVRARVQVEIAEYRSRSIFVLGEVRSPGKYIIEGPPVTLLEVIAKAGSFTNNAGPELIVQRYKDGMAAAVAAAPASPDSEATAELLRVSIDDLKQGRFTANVLLQDNDTIIVNAAERYYITGFVKTPGSFVLRPGMTVGQAIAEAGGLTERGSTRRLKIVRRVNGKEKEFSVGMNDRIQANDTIRVPQRLI